MSDLAARLMGVRTSNQLSTRGFALALAQAGYPVSHTSVSGYENGTGVPAAYVSAVASLFDVDPEWLLTGRGLPVVVEASQSDELLRDIAERLSGFSPPGSMAQRRLDAFFSLSRCPFAILTPHVHIVRWNQAFQDLTGRTPHELDGGSLLEWVHPEDRPAVSNKWSVLAAEGGSCDGSYRLNTVSRGIRKIECHATADRSFLYAVIRDATDRHLVRTLATAVDACGDCVFITDRDGVIEYVNPQFTATTGYSREDVTGRTPSFLASDRHDAPFFDDLWSHLLSGQTWRGVIINRRKNGELFRDERTISPVTGDDGGITHFVSTGRDLGPEA